MFKKNKLSIDIANAELKRLREENTMLKKRILEVEKYKNEYQDLISKIKELKKEYEEQIKAYENIRLEFEKEANRIKRNLIVK